MILSTSQYSPDGIGKNGMSVPIAIIYPMTSALSSASTATSITVKIQMMTIEKFRTINIIATPATAAIPGAAARNRKDI
jgi:hypothetical protein